MAHTRRIKKAICPRCGRSFIRNKDQRGKTAFCNWRCRASVMKEVICKNCKKKFSIPNLPSRNRIFCSKQCVLAAKYKYGPAHDGVKKCTNCAIEKPVYEFGKSKRTKDGFIQVCLKCTKEKRLKKKYNGSLSDVEGKRCGICDSPFEICLDHDHDLNKVRGALCRKCNSALGLFQEDLENLKNAAEYLQKFRPKYEVKYCEKDKKWQFIPEKPTEFDFTCGNFKNLRRINI